MNNNCNNCDNLYQFRKLINVKIKDIQHLETETVRYRYALSRYLPDHEEKIFEMIFYQIWQTVITGVRLISNIFSCFIINRIQWIQIPMSNK